MSNVRALISRVQRQRFRTTAQAARPAFRSTQMQFVQAQSSSASASVLRSAKERRFALLEKSVGGLRFAHLVQSVNGLRFAQLNSQKVGFLRSRRPFVCSNPVRLQRARYCQSTPRFARLHSSLVRRVQQPASVEHAVSVRFGHQRPNPSVEGTVKRLRLLSAPHLAR
jgi:hypothetical protein